MSSTFGRSVRSFRPKRIRNSFVVAYMNGRPTTCLRPTILIRCRSSSVLRTPDVLTPRISVISSGGDRLLVGDDRQRLERLHRQLLRRALVEQPAHPLVQVRPRDDLIAAGHLDQLQPARPLVVLLQLGERRLHVFLRLGVEQLVDRLRRQRLGRREDQRLEDRLQLGRRRASAQARPRSSRSACLRGSAVCPSCLRPSACAFLPFLPVLPSCPSCSSFVIHAVSSGSPIGCGASAGRARL